MFTFPISRRQADRPAARRPRTRRPLVEDLEGRQLLSGIQGNHIGMNLAGAPVGSHIGTSFAGFIVGTHINTSAMVRGGHVGNSVVSDVVVMRKH